MFFPGGRVDDADVVTARNPALAIGFVALDDRDAAARTASARAALEDTGILLTIGAAIATDVVSIAYQTINSPPCQHISHGCGSVSKVGRVSFAEFLGSRLFQAHDRFEMGIAWDTG